MVSSGDDAAMLPKGGSIAEVSSCRSVAQDDMGSLCADTGAVSCAPNAYRRSAP
jgi:hypothetical protein